MHGALSVRSNLKLIHTMATPARSSSAPAATAPAAFDIGFHPCVFHFASTPFVSKNGKSLCNWLLEVNGRPVKHLMLAAAPTPAPKASGTLAYLGKNAAGFDDIELHFDGLRAAVKVDTSTF